MNSGVKRFGDGHDDRSEQQLSVMSTSLLRLNPATSAAATAQQYALAQTSAIATARAGPQRSGTG